MNIIHMIEEERKTFLNSMRGFSDEGTYHLDQAGVFDVAEGRDYMITQWLNSVEWGTIPKAFQILLNNFSKKYNRHT